MPPHSPKSADPQGNRIYYCQVVCYDEFNLNREEGPTVQEGRFSQFDHVGILVENLEAAIHQLESLGIGPFKPFNKVVRYDTRLYGKTVAPEEIQLNTRLADLGRGFKIELIQPLIGAPWREFVDRTGGGVHHLAFLVDDVDKEVDNFIKKGSSVIYQGRYEGGGGAAYLDSRKFNPFFEVIEFVNWAPGMLPD